MCVLFLIYFVITGVAARELSDEEYYSLPQLFHLDDYDSCLSHSDGLYCLGTFHITPENEPHRIYDLIKKYSEKTNSFNRTLIHRGYCVSFRCPERNVTAEHNATLRFERCVAQWGGAHAFRTRLRTLHYCRTHAHTDVISTLDVPQLIFLIVICFVILLNIIGSLYDFNTRDNPKRTNTILISWSILSNWKYLTASHNISKCPSMRALQGIRVCIAICICLSHSGLIYYTLYLYNPRIMEKIAIHPLTMTIQNSTAMEQMFVVISCFLCAFNLRRTSKKHGLSFKILPKLLAKRIFRLAPVCLLVVSFAATWWPKFGDGPIWSATVGAESNICRDKFWSHALFLNNLIDAQRTCILPTWYIAVDMQMHIVSTVLVLTLARLRNGALTILGILFVASCLLNSSLAFAFDWKPMLYLTVAPENLRTVFRDNPSFTGLYISPWGNLNACFLGLILGHIYFEKRGGNIETGRHKWLLYFTCLISLPLLVGWTLLGYFIQQIKLPLFVAVYAALERSIFQILCLLSYVVLSFTSGLLMRILSWRGWHALGRMSLSVMLLHWCVNMFIVGSTPQPIAASIKNIAVDGVATALFTYLLAILVTILLEIPMKKTFEAIIS